MLKRCILSLLLLAASILANASTPSFEFVDTQGRHHALTEYRGKWVLVNLWATWCAACLTEMPELEALGRSRDDVVVLGLAVDGQSARRVMQFADKLRVTYPIIAGNDELAKPFRPRGYPTSILFDPSGKQIFVKEGPVTRQEIEKALSRPAIN